MRVALNINLIGEGDAFQTGNHGLETARILRHMIDHIEDGMEGRFDLRDVNGNWVGTAVFERVAE